MWPILTNKGTILGKDIFLFEEKLVNVESKLAEIFIVLYISVVENLSGIKPTSV